MRRLCERGGRTCAWRGCGSSTGTHCGIAAGIPRLPGTAIPACGAADEPAHVGGAGMRPERNGKKPKDSLEEAAQGNDPGYAAAAAHMLAGLCVGDDELARAEALLDGLPQPAPDASLLRALIAEKRGDVAKTAKRMLQTLAPAGLQSNADLPCAARFRAVCRAGGSALPSFGCMKRAPRLWGILLP